MNPESLTLYLALAAMLLLAELFYFRIAVRYRIVDKPNERSSHGKPVIRGGGVILIFASWLWFFYQGGIWPWFMLGLTAVALVSFVDDVASLPTLVRFLVHLASVLLIFYQLSLFTWPLSLVVLAVIICIGTLNAFNFMDGINGITGVYALVSLLTFLYVDQYIISFTDPTFIHVILIAVLVFLFFNFRVKARCFAGDIGSVTLAFIQVFLLLQLIHTTGHYGWALLFLVFGMDSLVTIIYRLKKGENIFKPHRSHLYQYLSNELKIPHLWVSTGYGLVQMLVNVLVVLYFQQLAGITIVFLLSYVLFYLMTRETILKRISVPGLFRRLPSP